MSMAAGGTSSASDAGDWGRVPGPGLLRPFSFPGVEQFELPNGLSVRFARTEGLPVVTVSLLAAAGGSLEASSDAGLATLTGSLLESGTSKMSGTEISDTLELLGVQLHVSTSWDLTFVELTALTSRLEPGLAVLADLVCQPTFPPDEVDRLRQEQLAAILHRRADPRGLANEAAARFIFSSESPYSRPLTGTATSVERITRDDIVRFHASRYAPAECAIVAAGNVESEQIRELLAARFADWDTTAAPATPLPVHGAPGLPEVILIDRPGAVQSEIRIGHLGVPRSTPDYFPVAVMNTVLGGAFSSRLNLNLRERHGYTYGASSAFSMRRQAGPFLVSTAVQTEVTVAAIREVLLELRRIREAPVSGPELDDARNFLSGVFPLRLQTTDGVASRLAELSMFGLPDDYFDHYRQRILDVSGEEVLRVARDHLHPDGLAIVVVGDAGRVRDELAAINYAPITLGNLENE